MGFIGNSTAAFKPVESKVERLFWVKHGLCECDERLESEGGTDLVVCIVCTCAHVCLHMEMREVKRMTGRRGQLLRMS